MRESLVLEEGAHVKGGTVCADAIAVLVSQHVVLLVVYFETDFVSAKIEEKDFVEFFELVDQHDVLILEARLQVLEDIKHEGLVVLVLPVVESWPVL